MRYVYSVVVWASSLDKTETPNHQLHFSKATAYHEIYNPRNRWSRDPALYHVFSMSESLLTMMDYPTAKKRKDILLPLFSRKAILDLQHLIQEIVSAQHTAGLALSIQQ